MPVKKWNAELGSIQATLFAYERVCAKGILSGVGGDDHDTNYCNLINV